MVALQLITEVQPGDELTDLTELVGSELADLMAADPTIDSINRGDLFDLGRSNDMASYLEEFSQRGAEGGGQTFRKVIIARKAAGGQASEPSEAGDTNNNSSTVMGRFVPATTTEAGSKALLLQHRDPRGAGEPAAPGGARDKAAGEAVTLTVVRGEHGVRGDSTPQLSLLCCNYATSPPPSPNPPVKLPYSPPSVGGER